MSEVIQLFPDLPVQCRKTRRYSHDRNGRYVFACQLPAGHHGDCQHRWQADTTPEPAA
jgi:hypothetical protein